MRPLARLNSVDVSIGFPPFSIDGSFTPSTAERDCAWELLVELTSRTSVAPLRDGEGSTREALSSLYTLYQTTRDLLRKYGWEVAAPRSDGNLSLGIIAMRVLNDILRPVMSKWHPALEAHEAGRPGTTGKADWEAAWPDNADCRRDLTAVRRSIRSYIDTLAAIAGTPDLADAAMSLAPAMPAPRSRGQQPIPDRFSPRSHMVRWVSVFEGTWVGIQKLRSGHRSASGSAADATIPWSEWCIDRSEGGEVWLDYLADLGDAFDPTMAVAWQIGRRQVELADDPNDELPRLPGPLPRADLVVMGGDEVYPSASRERYERQLIAPYALAFEHPQAEERPMVVALPGNHDWMGGVEHFEEVFVGMDATGLGEWKAGQPTRWFCIKLPGGWWMWGLDSGLGDDLGEEQQAYFADAATRLGPDDRVVICTAVPLWQMRAKRAEEYVELRQLLKDWLGDREVPIWLSGDSHYFAVYESTGGTARELHVTSGGGGAFMHPTHSLPTRVPYERGRAEFELRSRWPNPADSRAVSPNARLLRDRQSLGVVPLVALLHGLFSWLAARQFLGWGSSSEPGGWPEPIGFVVSTPWTIVVLALLVVIGRATVAPNARERLVARGAKRLGYLHGALLAAIFWATTAAIHWAVDTWLDLDGAGRRGLFVLGSVISGAVVYATFLRVIGWIGNRYRMNDNLAFAAVHSGRYKHFVRMRFTEHGDLTMYAVGLDPIGTGWGAALRDRAPVPPDDPDGTPLLHYVWGTHITGRDHLGPAGC